MTTLSITAGPYTFRARLEEERAPKTCAAFSKLLPFEQKVIHVRWSGESTWIPLGDFDVGVGFENHTSHPRPARSSLYPGGFSETEILLPVRRLHVLEHRRPARRQPLPDGLRGQRESPRRSAR